MKSDIENLDYCHFQPESMKIVKSAILKLYSHHDSHPIYRMFS
jgi:hypothetical protein